MTSWAGYAAEMRVIPSEQWREARFHWLKAVRLDHSLSTTVRLLAHALALEYAHHKTGECYPSPSTLAANLGVSVDTVKRSLAELTAAGWISRATGGVGGRGRAARIQFLSKARIVPLRAGDKKTLDSENQKPGATVYNLQKGGTGAPLYDPKKGGADAPLSKTKRGASVRGKGGMGAPPYIEPYINHKRGPADLDEKARFWADKISADSFIPQNALSRDVIQRILTLELVDAETLKRRGFI
ncbi:MAG: hypothetical protein CML66_25820 [Rhodobacteraceae bacterium]|nr:hypothetical protein [Paracoccaceae bacterium]